MTALMTESHESQALIESAQAGDREAFETLTSHRSQRIHALIASRLNARIVFGVDPEDVYQETLLRAFQSIERFEWRGEGSFLRWLGGIAENVILHLARKQARERSTSLEEDVPTQSISPGRAIRRDDRFHRLKDSLDQLRPDHREAITLVRLKGMTFEQVAEQMGRSPEAVKRLLHRALKSLKSAFGDTESLHLPVLPTEQQESEDDE